MSQSTVEIPVARLSDGRDEFESDLVAVEEPLEIRLQFDRDGVLERRTVSITMRTPGNDAELAAGFLFTEGIIHDRAQIAEIRHCGAQRGGEDTNVIRLRLASGSTVDVDRLTRHFYTTSSCGVCGKTSIEALRATSRYTLTRRAPLIGAAFVHRLPLLQREAQAAFACTGGLHASALFSTEGDLISIREDVGRHNALDKVIGAELLAGRLPASDRILLVSGRASFELVQKAVMAGIPVLAAVGAPSSLAVELATEAGMTLLGFVRDGRFNVYAGAERIPFDAS
jgi:FdhD protein